MKYLNGTDILCLTYAELVPSIMSIAVYDKAKQRENITVHGIGGNGREVLIEYDSLPPKYKKAVQAAYGNPYEYMAKQPILNLVERDFKALEFYTSEYTLPNGRKLPEEYVEKYTQAASWLNAIRYITGDKRALKRELNVTVGEFWELAIELIQVKKVALPASYKRLTAKLKEYNGQNYACLIEEWRFGNDNGKKVKDEVAEALLLEMIAHPHQHDDTVIAAKYNEWAQKSGRKLITSGAVAYRRKKNEYLVTEGREGKAKNYTKYSKQIHRDRTSAPLLFVNSDDNILDLYFQEEQIKNGKRMVNTYWRPALYVVTDTYNDYILGYAIGDTVTIELVKEAYRNAMHHVMELTGSAYCWQQIQTDRWAIGKESELTKFFESQANFTPATAKVAQGKYIERSFGTVWHQNLKMFMNYAGHNITAKERTNPDAIERNRKDFPLKENAPQVVATFINMMRQSINRKSGKPRQQEWLSAFRASEKSKQKQLSEEARLQIFGVELPKRVQLTQGGLQFQLNRQPFTFDIPELIYNENVGKKVQVIYDPYDMSQVLVTDGKGLRFVANEYENLPAALADFKEGIRTKLNDRLEEKKRLIALPGQEQQRRKDVLIRANVDADSLLQAGVVVKEIRHQAEKAVVRRLAGARDQEEDDQELNIYQYM